MRPRKPKDLHGRYQCPVCKEWKMPTREFWPQFGYPDVDPRYPIGDCILCHRWKQGKYNRRAASRRAFERFLNGDTRTMSDEEFKSWYAFLIERS